MGEKLERRTEEKSTKQDILKGVHLFFADVLSDFVLCLLEFYGVYSREKGILFRKKIKKRLLKNKIRCGYQTENLFCGCLMTKEFLKDGRQI